MRGAVGSSNGEFEACGRTFIGAIDLANQVDDRYCIYSTCTAAAQREITATMERTCRFIAIVLVMLFLAASGENIPSGYSASRRSLAFHRRANLSRRRSGQYRTINIPRSRATTVSSTRSARSIRCARSDD